MIPAAWAPRLLSLLRIVASAMYLTHGTMKLFAFPAAMGPNGGTIPVLSMIGAAGVIEVVGGALLLLGLFTRPAAFIVAGEMAFAFFIAHFPRGFWPVTNGGEAPVFYCFLFLYIAAAGPGPWSLDAVRMKGASRA